jgi:flagellar protein FlgJ
MQINGIGKEVALTAKSAIDARNKTRDTDFAAAMEKASASVDGDKDKARLKKACQEMESVFLNLMLTKMRDTVPKSKLFGDSSQEEIIRSMLDSEMTKDLAKAGGIGLADMLYRQLTLETEAKTKSQAPK